MLTIQPRRNLNARTTRALKSLMNALRSNKNTHRLEDISIVLDQLAELPEVRLFAMLYQKTTNAEPKDFKD